MNFIIAAMKKLFFLHESNIVDRDTPASGKPCDDKNRLIEELTIKLTQNGKIIVLDEKGREIKPTPGNRPIPASEILNVESACVLLIRENPCYAYIQTSSGWIRRQVPCP